METLAQEMGESRARSDTRDIFDVTLEFFSGPMDLLLHLVSQQEVPIERVQMSVIAEQYLEIVSNHAANLDLEAASEYLVIAATLLAIKSRSLLPAEQGKADEPIEAEFEASRFFEDLRSRLQAYELTRKRAEGLMQTPQLGVDTFVRIDRQALQCPVEELGEGEDAFRLGALFQNLVRRINGVGSRMRIHIEPISVVSYMMRIIDTLRGPALTQSLDSQGRGNFRGIVRSFLSSPGHKSDSVRSVVVGSFIALLELAKRGVLSVAQESEQAEIDLTLKIIESQPGELHSEFDEVESSMPAEAPEAENQNNVLHMADYRKSPADSDIAGVSNIKDDEQNFKTGGDGTKEVGNA